MKNNNFCLVLFGLVALIVKFSTARIYRSQLILSFGNYSTPKYDLKTFFSRFGMSSGADLTAYITCPPCPVRKHIFVIDSNQSHRIHIYVIGISFIYDSSTDLSIRVLCDIP